MLYPLTFHPIFKERVWGGRSLERLFAKPLPDGKRIGESWEISDRPGDVSVVAQGPLAGKDLRWLMEHQRQTLLGDAPDQQGRFPLLIKILDAQEDLSLQVHPPASQAADLGGEPKTEMWYVVDAAANAAFYAGLRRGVTRTGFVQRLRDGSVAECFHRLAVARGDSLFLPSGRVHAIGGGNVLFEIQQNSDTTYRVFDWNRVGLDGRPRELHVEQSLECIDFEDFEPALAPRGFSSDGASQYRLLADDALFRVEVRRLRGGGGFATPAGRMTIVGQVEGNSSIGSKFGEVWLVPGQFSLIPASVEDAQLRAEGDCEFLIITVGTGR
ncbi:MAG: class I mannose-6-phosphate isomerase [Verrucomicrobia bacterium]|jgi:mannose-6-phosphate isomerase|nr:class I mannose-6-phosphate isomerase [Verrucomicrobiota bacterium]